METDIKPDMSCVPYRRKKLYFLLTVPLVVLLMAVFVYLWTFSLLLSIVFLSFYLAICFFQAYCCAYQDCPYVGGFCPAIVGILPSDTLAKLIYGQQKIVKSEKRFELHAALASVG